MRKSSLLTAAAIAVVAYAAADLVHEVMGHALVAKASGIRVLSISTVAAPTEWIVVALVVGTVFVGVLGPGIRLAP